MNGATAVVVVVAIQTLAGLGVLALIGLGRTRAELARYSPIAPLAGMAWSGVVAATLPTLGSRLDLAGLVVLTIVTCVCGALRLTHASPDVPLESARARSTSWVERTAAGAALVALVAVAIVALAAFRVLPLAQYDAWAIWGMKARAIATLGAADPAVFASPAYARLHIEYPLLLPGLHALPLQAADGFSSNTVVLSCLAVGSAGLLGFWGLLRDRVRPALLLPVVAAIATAPAFFGQLATAYADVPLAVLVAAGAVAAARWLLTSKVAWLSLATLFFAAAALTKNEGLLFAAAALLPLFVVAAGRRRAVALSALVVAVAYAPWKAYTTVYGLSAPDYDLSSSLNVPWVVDRLGRGRIAGDVLLGGTLERSRFGFLLLLGVAAIVVTLLVGPRALGVFGAGFAGLSFVGLTWIYVITPYEVTFYLSTNSNRIIVSLVITLAALAPLLVEESAEALSGNPPRPRSSDPVGSLA